MKDNSPLISAIISTYNSEDFIAGKIEDLLNQTIVDKLEIIIVNSGSEQKEKQIVSEFITRFPRIIKYIETENRETIYRAWNRGIKISSGLFITNANTDDRLKNNFLEIMTSNLEEKHDAAIIYADQIISEIPNQKFDEVKSRKYYKRPDFSRIRLLSNYICGSQLVWKSSLNFVDNFWFNEKYEVAGDYDFVCRVAEKYKIIHFPHVLGSYYKSPKNENKELQNLERTIGETDEIRSIYTPRYLEKLSECRRKILALKMFFLSMLPERINWYVWRVLNIFTPRIQSLSYEFICWFGSKIAEFNGHYKYAYRYCGKFSNLDRAPFLKRQKVHLNKKINNE